MKKMFVIAGMFLLLPACVASIGSAGPEGPIGPPGPAGAQGPAGPANRAPQQLAVLRTTTDLLVVDSVDVVIAEGSNLAVSLPPARQAGSGRTITVRAVGGKTRLLVAQGDRIEAGVLLAIDRDEMVTVISDGGNQWTIIASSDL